jgi:hypothetical protein
MVTSVSPLTRKTSCNWLWEVPPMIRDILRQGRDLVLDYLVPVVTSKATKPARHYPCPGSPTTAFHANNINDLGGCALAVAYESDVSNEVKPDDFTVFSVNHTCVWNLHTYFSVPADMPPCPNDKCTCAWLIGYTCLTQAPSKVGSSVISGRI